MAKKTETKRQTKEDLQALREAVRAPLHPLQEARIYARLMEELDTKTQRELARHLGVSQARISQRLALLTMPREIVKLLELRDGGLTERHARTIRRIPDPKLQVWLAQRVQKDGLTVEQTEDIVIDMLNELGIVVGPTSRSLWNRVPGLRWRNQEQLLELQVRGATRAEQLKGLQRFVELFKKGK